MRPQAARRPLLLAMLAALWALPGCALDPTLLAALGTDATPGSTTTSTASTSSTGQVVGPLDAPNTTGLFTTTGGFRTPAGATTSLKVLDIVNQARGLAGLQPVTLDEEMSTACAHHAHYIVLNKGTPAVEEGLNAHHEDMSLPGATADGKQAGESADITWDEPLVGIYGLIATLYHRSPVLRPGLTKIGFATERDASGYESSVLMFNSTTAPGAVVAFPADGQVDVPLRCRDERPNPIPAGAGPAGYPVTLATPGKLTGVTASISDASGRDVPAHFSDYEHQASDFPQGNVACMYPKEPLQPNTRYRVHISGTLDGQARDWAWSFTTEAPKPADAQRFDELAELAGHAVTLQGDVTNATLLPDGSLQLRLSTVAKRFVSVTAPAALGLSPDAFVARRVSITGALEGYNATSHAVQAVHAGDLKVVEAAPPVVDATDDEAMQAAIGHLTTVRGTVVRAGVTSGTSGSIYVIFQATPDHTAFISAAAWQQLKLGSPASLKGKTLAIRCIPSPNSAPQAIQLVVTTADQVEVAG